MAKDFIPSRRNGEAYEALTDTLGSVPPQAVELEEAVLGALMLEKDSIIAVQEFVTPNRSTPRNTGSYTRRSKNCRWN